VERSWEGSPEIAIKLMGKDKVNYSAHMDSGNYVVVINAKNKSFGKKEVQRPIKVIPVPGIKRSKIF
jgi:ribosomal protein L13